MPTPVDPATFAAIADAYSGRWGLRLVCFDRHGAVLHGDQGLLPDLDGLPERLIDEALRWGEPTICASGEATMHWAVPLMVNAKILGALASGCHESLIFPGGDGQPVVDLQEACAHLRELAEQFNLTNGALLAERRRDYRSEQERAYLLHESKAADLPVGCSGIQETYLREEPYLLSAIRQGQPEQARHMLNRLLLVIYSNSDRSLDLMKALLLELAVSMSRAAIEAGGAAEDLLGVRFGGLTALYEVSTEEGLADWVTATFNHIMSTIAAQEQRGDEGLLLSVRGYIRDHLDEGIKREDLAQAVGISPAKLSKMVRELTGHSWTDELARMRVDRSLELLRSTDLPLSAVAVECGFADQSYFTKTFKKITGKTPSSYR